MVLVGSRFDRLIISEGRAGVSWRSKEWWSWDGVGCRGDRRAKSDSLQLRDRSVACREGIREVSREGCVPSSRLYNLSFCRRHPHPHHPHLPFSIRSRPLSIRALANLGADRVTRVSEADFLNVSSSHMFSFAHWSASLSQASYLTIHATG